MCTRFRRRSSWIAAAIHLAAALSMTAACEPTKGASSADSQVPSPATSIAASVAPASPASPEPRGAAKVGVAGASQAGFYRTRVGDVDLTVLSDGTVGLDVSHGLALNAKPGELDRLLTHAFQRSPIDASFNAFLTTLDGRTLLVDTGSAANMGPTAGKLAHSLVSAGTRPEDVTDVFITHVHPDHTGGLVVDGKRAFPNATIHVDQKDLDYWLDKARASEATGMQATFFAAAQASLHPYVDSGQVKGFTGATQFLRGFRAEPAYGHTPGHVMYVLESNGQKLVFWGDLIHIAAVQFDDPGVAVAFDVNPAMAVETCKRALAEAADKGYLVAQNHVAFPGLGHVRRDADAYGWVPLPYVNDAAAK
jgi:glyoxylase-like metal-dependent hydrolase (beta-lactamase superfamily II)